MKNPIFWLSLFCAAAFLWQLFQLFSGLKSQSWPATLAVIKRVSTEERDQGDGDISYDVNVEYTYRVDRSSLVKTAIFGALTMVCTIITIYVT